MTLMIMILAVVFGLQIIYIFDLEEVIKAVGDKLKIYKELNK